MVIHHTKKGKSALLFFILLVVATLALSAISIKNASKEASENLRKVLGGGFVMEQDTHNSSKQVQRDLGNGTTAIEYVGETLTEEIAEKVAKVSGVKNYNAEVIGPAELKSPAGKHLSLKSIEGSYFANDESMNRQVTLYGFTGRGNCGGNHRDSKRKCP